MRARVGKCRFQVWSWEPEAGTQQNRKPPPPDVHLHLGCWDGERECEARVRARKDLAKVRLEGRDELSWMARKDAQERRAGAGKEREAKVKGALAGGGARTRSLST